MAQTPQDQPKVLLFNRLVGRIHRACVCGISRAAVKSQLHRTRARVREPIDRALMSEFGRAAGS